MRMTQEILPSLSASAKAMADKPASEPDQTSGADSLPPELEFTPVPRQRQTGRNTITPDRQRAFIRALAQTGSVALSSKVIGNAPASLYALKLHANAKSFAAAWDAAVQLGARQILDIMVDHAINGTPEFIYKDGELVAERRVFNHRMMMWIVSHAMPEHFGVNTGLIPHGATSSGLKKLKDAWREEWQKEWEAQHLGRATEEETNAALLVRLKILHKRNQHEMYVPWMDDAEKRAACEVLYGVQDWDAIRAAAHKAALNGRFEPEEEARLGYRGR